MQSFDNQDTLPLQLTLRPYKRDQDTLLLCRIYREAVMRLGSPYYNAAQRQVWALWSQSPQLVERMLSQGWTIVAVNGGEMAGFAQLHPESYINMLYVAPKHCRQGIGAALLKALEEKVLVAGLPVVQAHASLVSRNLFRKMGYRALAYAPVTRHGIELPRHLMEKTLSQATSTGK
ncbi:GNAT family N-acetyltransferase [Mangrovitalea sediminis]|uniref:GNAT family N-acetyltransferase n=1 Tax=Mangrovitalea sediminis TaxID=1982043 RepID=UPI000BE5B13B|nr:GNAT family N-acetyltransferase [Mangrovitalea sediminis]